MVPESLRYLKVTQRSRASKRYQKVVCILKVYKGPSYPKGTLKSIVFKSYIKVLCILKVYKGPTYPKGTLRSIVLKSYRKVLGIQKVSKGLSYLKGTFRSIVFKSYLKVKVDYELWMNFKYVWNLTQFTHNSSGFTTNMTKEEEQEYDMFGLKLNVILWVYNYKSMWNKHFHFLKMHNNTCEQLPTPPEKNCLNHEINNSSELLGTD